MVREPTLHGQQEQADFGCLVGSGGVISHGQVHPNIAEKRMSIVLYEGRPPIGLVGKERGGYLSKNFIKLISCVQVHLDDIQLYMCAFCT